MVNNGPAVTANGVTPTSTSPGVENTNVDLRGVLGLVRRRKWTILLTVVGVVGIAILLVSQLQPKYTATALVVVDSREAQLFGLQAGSLDANSPVVDTEVEIAKSSTVLRRAAEALNLAGSADFTEKPSAIALIQTMLGLKADANPRPDPSTLVFTELPPEAQVELVEDFAKAVSIGRRGMTSVISISATLSTPDAAAEAANAVANSYLNEQVEARITANQTAATALHDRVETLAASIADIDEQIDAFVTAKLAELGSVEAQNLLARIADESRKRDAGRVQLADIERGLGANDLVLLARFAEAQQAGITASRQALLQELAAETDQTQLAQAKLRLDALDKEIRAAAERQATTIQSEISLSNGLTAAFRSQIEATLSDLQLPREVAVELARLQREADTRRSLYEGLLERLRQVEQQSDFRIPDSRVIAEATAPTETSFPPRRLIVASALFLSLCAGFGLAVVRERFIGGVTSIEQLEALTGLSVLAAVPRPNGGGRERPDQEVVARPLSPYSEAIRRVHLGINSVLPLPKEHRTIFLTSAVPGDGKTTMALALARQMAMTGSSVLLIDADLRHPSVHRYLDEQTTDGLINFLSRPGETAVDQLTITREPASGVSFVLGAESSSIATDALLMSRRFDELMSFARSKYDVVIVDTPPLGLVVDAAVVARHCDLGIFVVRYASTNQHAVSTSLRDLARLEVPICGVLNQVEKAEGYRYGHSRAYRNYYESTAA